MPYMDSDGMGNPILPDPLLLLSVSFLLPSRRAIFWRPNRAWGMDGWTLHEEGNCGPFIRHLKITLKMQRNAAFKTHGLRRPCSLSPHHKTTVCPTAADCCNINPAFFIQKSRGMQAIYTSGVSTLLQLKDLRHGV